MAGLHLASGRELHQLPMVMLREAESAAFRTARRKSPDSRANALKARCESRPA